MPIPVASLVRLSCSNVFHPGETCSRNVLTHAQKVCFGMKNLSCQMIKEATVTYGVFYLLPAVFSGKLKTAAKSLVNTVFFYGYGVKRMFLTFQLLAPFFTQL